jgi:hypothetical protein
LNRASLRRGHGGGTLEWILQFVIMIAIQTTNRSRLLRALQLSLDETLLAITNWPEQFRTATEIASLYTSIPIYFTLSIKGAPF